MKALNLVEVGGNRSYKTVYSAFLAADLFAPTL